MVWNCKKKQGSRPYNSFSDKDLDDALQIICEGTMSIYAASKEFKILYGTNTKDYMSKNLAASQSSRPSKSWSAQQSVLIGLPANNIRLSDVSKIYSRQNRMHFE